VSLSAADRLDILDVITRADSAAGRRDADTYASLFTDDAVLDGAQGRHAGRDQLRASVGPIWAAEGPASQFRGFGGTWYWNRYPGAQCDTSAMIYMPLLEETGHMPAERYAHAPEIRAHCDRIARQYGLYDNALFHTEVTDLEWDASGCRWIVRTNRGDEFTAQFVGIGTGPLHVPKLPGIPGIETFEGRFPHQPLGLRLHRRRPRGRADGPPGRPAGRRHRDGGDHDPVRLAPGQCVRGTVRLPADAVVGGCP
jgi:SnoaL-like domain